MKAEGKYPASGDLKEYYDTTIEMQNGRVSKQSIQSIVLSSPIPLLNATRAYQYDAEGQLVSVTSTVNKEGAKPTPFMALTWENGNITKIEVTNDEVTETLTYTYDDKAYIPMSDVSPYAPLAMYVIEPVKEFYNKMGKNNKNNVKTLTRSLSTSSGQYEIRSMTYDAVVNENNSIKQINLAGVYTPHFWDEDQNPVSFGNLYTKFEYTPIYKK